VLFIRSIDVEASNLLVSKSSTTSVGIEASIILIMTNQRIGDNPLNDAARHGKAPSRAEFQILQQSVHTQQQAMQQVQEALERLETGFNQAHRDQA
jgi:hypothetical protein